MITQIVIELFYFSSKQYKSYFGSNMSNQINPHKEKHSTLKNIRKEFSMSLKNKKHIDLFSDNKSLKIPANKLVQRSQSKQSTKENTIKENKDTKRNSNDKDKNIIQNKEIFNIKRKDDKLSSKVSISSSSKTKSHKTDEKCGSKHRNSGDNKTNSNENKISRLKMKDTQLTSKDKHLHIDKVNVSKLNCKSSKTYSNLNRLKETQDVYIPKKITERRKSYHDDNLPHNDKEEDSIFKRRNSHASSKTTCLESDKKLNILQNNKQLSSHYSQSRKRSTSSSDAQSEKENSKKHSPEKSRRPSLNCTKTADSKKDTNNENKFDKNLDTNERRKRSYSEFSLFSNELDLNNESKRPKTNAENSSAFSAFSSLDDNEVITIDKMQMLPPVNDSNSPYVSFGDFLKNKSIPLVESSPALGPEFSCTQLGDKLVIKKKSTEKKAIVIDITDEDNDGDDGTNNVMQDDNDIFSKSTPKKDYDAKRNIITNAAGKSDVPNIICKKNTHEISKNSSKITQKKELDVKIKNCDNKISFDGEHLNNNPKCEPGSNYKKKTQKVTESSSKRNDSESNKTNAVEKIVDSVDERKKHKVTESSPKISPKKHCDVKKKSSDNKTSVKERLDNNHEISSDSNNKRKAQSVTEISSKTSSKKDSYEKTESPESKSNVVDSLNNNHGSTSDSTQKKKIQKDNENSPKRDCDVKIKSSDNNKKVGKSPDTNKDCSLIEKLVNSKPDKNNLQILFTEQAVEFISSDFVSVLNVYIDYKKYTEKLLMSKGTDNKEVNNKDYFTNHRSKFLKLLCKKLQNAKVYNFKLGYFFDSLIESIKIHIAAKEILNEKTINRFIHNVLILFRENCSTPDDHYILYNHVVSVKSLQYLDQKSFSLPDCVDKHIFDCMNSFSVKLERYKEPSNSRNKDTALPRLFCIDDSPDKITNVTPGNSLPCINTGENLVERIGPNRSSDVDKIPQISIADTNIEKDKKEDDLIDLLQNVPFDVNSINHVAQLPLSEKNTNNQSTTIETLNNDALTESIVSELHALFNEKESVIQNTNEVNLIKSPTMNYETSPSISDETIKKCATLHRTEIVDSPKSDNSDCMNFLKNINQNKSFLAPIFNDKTMKTSSLSYSESFNNVTNSVLVTSTSTSAPVAINKDTSNKNIKVLHNIVVLPATKQTFNSNISENICTMQETNKSSEQIEIASSSENEITNALSVVSPQAPQTLTSPDNLLETLETKEKNKVTKRSYVRRKPLSERKKRSVKEIGSQLSKVNPIVETSTALPRPFPKAKIQNNTFVPSNEAMKEYLNSKVANALENSPSYMVNQIPQQFNLLPKTTVAPIQMQPTTPSYIPHRQYSHPVQTQQTAPVGHPSTQTSQTQPQTNLVPLFWQMSASSQVLEPPPAPIMSRSSSYLPPLLSKNSSVMSPQQPTRNQHSYFPNMSTSETFNRSSYTSSIGVSPMNLQSSVPHGQMTQLVALQQVVERTLVQRVETQTVRTEQNPNVPQYGPNPNAPRYAQNSNVPQYGQNQHVLQYGQNVYQSHLEEINRRLRYQQAEQERQNESLRHQEMLKQYHQEVLRLQQCHQEANRAHHQQEMHRLREQERVNPDMYLQYKNYNQNKATMCNLNNYNSVPSGQVAQSKPNQYTYPTYLMPQSINNSVNVNGGIVSYMNSQQTMQNESRRNNISTAASLTQSTENNNLVYPHMTYPRTNINSHQNSTANNSVQAAINQTVRNPNIVPIRDNTVPSVSHTSVIVRNNASSLVAQHKVSSNATRTFSHQLGNEQQLLRADRSENNGLVDKQKEAQRNTNNSLEQHLTELEELINDSDTRGNKEMDNIGVRNSSRDSGYMTPTKQFQRDQTCAYCLGVGNFVCSGCVNVYYCSEVCQKKAWPSHQKNCF